jgi:hypothetical protein
VPPISKESNIFPSPVSKHTHEGMQNYNFTCHSLRECIQKFPDWPPAARTAMAQLSATRCSCIAILWVSLVSFAAITHSVASQRVYIVISLSTQSGNLWIHPRMGVKLGLPPWEKIDWQCLITGWQNQGELDGQGMQHAWRCIQKCLDWIDNVINTNKHSFRSNTKGHGHKIH